MLKTIAIAGTLAAGLLLGPTLASAAPITAGSLAPGAGERSNVIPTGQGRSFGGGGGGRSFGGGGGGRSFGGGGGGPRFGGGGGGPRFGGGGGGPRFGGGGGRRWGGGGGHNHSHRHYRRYYGGGGYGYGYYPYYGAYYNDYSYGSDCSWLRRRALRSGSSYWWRRYDACVSGY